MALVAEDGREFNVELLDTWRPRDCCDFVIEIVLPRLGTGAHAMPIIEARVAMLQILESFGHTLEHSLLFGIA